MIVGSQIVGSGTGFPSLEMKNSDFESFVETNDEWIRTRTGIETRRIADRKMGETTLTLAHMAAMNALEMSGVAPSELGLIVMGTVTPDTVMPTTANQLQALLGADHAFTFDLQAACSGFLYGLSIADNYIKSGTIETALVIGGDTLSTLINWQDRSTCVLFGDGAGAVVLKRSTDPTHRILSTRLYSDGRYGKLLQVPHGYGKVPPWTAEYRHDMHKIQMEGREVFKVAVRAMVEASHNICKENDVTPKDVDFFFFHQANMRIIEMCARVLGVEKHKTWLNVNKYGNTSAATLPVCLDEAWRSHVVRPGDLILMTTFGGGLTWATSLFRL